MKTFSSIEKALIALKAGQPIILVDDEHRENEGDIIFAAERITPKAINFLIRNGSGIICLCLTEFDLEKLELDMMVPDSKNTCRLGTGFTVSIDAKQGITTGVSAADRAHTILTAINEKTKARDLARPGHVFPLRAKKGGVLERAGHTEGSIDLMRIAGLKPAAVLCELMNPDGTMMRGESLMQFAEQHQLSIISIAELVNYRLRHEISVTEVARAMLPIKNLGEFNIHVFQHALDNSEHVALTKLPVKNKQQATLVRMHSECLTGDIFNSLRCDCGWQLQKSLEKINEEGGVLLYLRQEGRGIGLANKIKAYALQEKGLDTVEANIHLGFQPDQRDYAVAAHMLKTLNIENIRLMTNNPEKIKAVESYGIKVVERVPHETLSTETNQSYLRTKREKLGHLLQILHHSSESTS